MFLSYFLFKSCNIFVNVYCIQINNKHVIAFLSIVQSINSTVKYKG